MCQRYNRVEAVLGSSPDVAGNEIREARERRCRPASRSCWLKQKLAAQKQSNFEGSILGCIEEKIPTNILYRAQLDNTSQFVHSKLSW